LGASALMQGLSDGYFILPYTVGDYIAKTKLEKTDTSAAEFRAVEAGVAELTKKLLSIRGHQTVDAFHRQLGKIVWDYCGMSRTGAGLNEAIGKIRELRGEYWRDVNVPGSADDLNQSLEKAGRVADFFELAELMCIDALNREESCGGHFREEYQTPDGEAQRSDETCAFVSAWEYGAERPELHREPLSFEYVHPSQRSYK
jgi:succinate dehydrogenase / fumarate reductase flavoprotein subunit